ncbi:transketolase [Enterococcus faecium]|nr:transketolase [Enterococcus faecium]
MINIHELEVQSTKLRKLIVQMVFEAESGHFGGSLSCIDLINYIYEKYIIPDGDFFLLSKGHAAPALYAKLIQLKFVKAEAISGFRKNGGLLTGHPSNEINGVSFGLGSLGQGASIAMGIALGQKLTKSNKKVFVLLGDGELNEGQNWEAFFSAKKLELNNLVVVIDRNRMQLDGFCEEVSGFDNLSNKLESFFGSKPIEMDGNNYSDIERGFSKIDFDAPTVIIANTVKGYGVNFMENNPDYHSYRIDRTEKQSLHTQAIHTLDEMEADYNAKNGG